MSIKKSLLTASVLAATLVSASAFAGSSASALSIDSNAGFIVGLQGGYANTNWDNLEPAAKDTGFAARVFAGYDMNQFLGLETGYTFLPRTTGTAPLLGNYSVRNYAVDLLAKLSVPVSNVFNIYAKAGAAYFNSRVSIDSVGTQNQSHIGPAFGVGAAYEVIPNLAIDLSWMRFSGDNALTHNYQPNPDMVLLGVSYKLPASFS